MWSNRKRDAAGIMEGFDHAYDDDLTDKKASCSIYPIQKPANKSEHAIPIYSLNGGLRLGGRNLDSCLLWSGLSGSTGKSGDSFICFNRPLCFHDSSISCDFNIKEVNVSYLTEVNAQVRPALVPRINTASSFNPRT